ncbi:MAG: 50S ribosomal protein L29 [Acidobacteria bacterium]|nr:MAG: 50S ribosomal protein L29 [Acidobacteriota bacterium]
MNIEKIRNLGPDELLHQQRDAADQLFRLKFQLKMGQTSGVKKIRELRKDLARIKTIARQRELGIDNAIVSNAAGTTATPKQEAAPAAVRKAAPAKKSSRAVAKKKSASAKRKTSAPKKKIAAKKSKAKR